MFCAHISEDKLRQQSIKNHLEETAELAGRFASVFGVENGDMAADSCMTLESIPPNFRHV